MSDDVIMKVNSHVRCDVVYTVNTDMCRLTKGIRSEKSNARLFRRCANVIQCTYTNLDSTVQPTTLLGYMV